MSGDCNNDPKGSICFRKQNGKIWMEYNGGSDVAEFDPRVMRYMQTPTNSDPLRFAMLGDTTNAIFETTGNGIKDIEMPGIEQVDSTSVRVYGGTRYCTDYENGTHSECSWETQVVVDPFVTSDTLSFFNVDETGGIQPTNEEQRDGDGDILCQVGVAAHNNKTQIDVVSFAPVLAINSPGSLRDVWDAVKLKNLDDGDVLYSAMDTTSNRLERTAGQIAGNRGRNASHNLYSANVTTLDEESPVLFDATGGTQFLFDVFNDGNGGTTGVPNFTGELDTTLRDDGSGAPVEMSDGYWGTWRVYIEPAGNITFYVKPQTEHKGRVEAIGSISTEVYLPPPATFNWLLRGYITARKGSSGFKNNLDVEIYPANRSGTAPMNPPTNGQAGLSVPNMYTYPFSSTGVVGGVYYVGGFNQFSSTDANLTQSSTTVDFGSINGSYAAHPYIVSGGPGTVDTGVVGLRANFTSITDDGVRTESDTEVLLNDITDVTAAALDKYVEVAKKLLGIVEFELFVVSGSPAAYSFDFNYGMAKYDDLGNRDFMVTDFEVTGFGDANDSAFDVELIHHPNSGFTYAATGFSPYDNPIVSLLEDHGTDVRVYNNQNFAYKRGNNSIDQPILGADSEGMMTRITQTSPGTVQIMAARVGVANSLF